MRNEWPSAFKAWATPATPNGFRLTTHTDALELPLSWKKPQMIFVNSMSDMSARDVQPLVHSKDLRCDAWSPSSHRFQVLTKRSDCLLKMSSAMNWRDNVWMGVSVERHEYVFRIDDLRKPGRRMKFVLGTSARAASQVQPARDRLGHDRGRIRPRGTPDGRGLGPGNHNTIQKAQIMFKQWGGYNKKKAGRLLRTSLGRTSEHRRAWRWCHDRQTRQSRAARRRCISPSMPPFWRDTAWQNPFPGVESRQDGGTQLQTQSNE